MDGPSTLAATSRTPTSQLHAPVNGAPFIAAHCRLCVAEAVAAGHCRVNVRAALAIGPRPAPLRACRTRLPRRAGVAAARRDALAYTAGVVAACAALGAAILLLRAAGEQVGWAFQLQEPAVVVSLFLLARRAQ